MLPALFLLFALQVPDSSPVRMWLGSGPSPAPGDPVRVYVQTSMDGNLVVLYAHPDGRVAVLFPAAPVGDPFVRAGTYEIRSSSDGAAFVAATGRSGGTVLAALSPDAFWFDEFVLGKEWNVQDRVGFDAEGLLTDVVQRMLGDGSFNYDLAIYAATSRPAPLTEAATGPLAAAAMVPPAEPATVPPASPCSDCDVTQVNIIVSDVPFGLVRHHHRRPPVPPAAPAAPASAIALYSAHRPLSLTQAGRAPALESVQPRRRVLPPAVVPRHREPEVVTPGDATTRAIPLMARARAGGVRPSALARSLALVRPARTARTSAAEPITAAAPTSTNGVGNATTLGLASVRPVAGPGTLVAAPEGAPVRQPTVPVEAHTAASGGPERRAPEASEPPRTFALPHPPGLSLYRARR